MATVKKGVLTRAGEWWVHLRPYGKRSFWKKHRKAEQRLAHSERQDQQRWHGYLRGDQR